MCLETDLHRKEAEMGDQTQPTSGRQQTKELEDRRSHVSDLEYGDTVSQ
jgi:hypothetical protein